VARLKQWGLLDRIVASNCPPLPAYKFNFRSFVLSGSPSPAEDIKEAYAPRRKVLDAILVEAAVAAGAELRTGFSVEELHREEDRVDGIRGRESTGPRVLERARIIVGAEGMHSAELLAEAVDSGFSGRE
jgi:flavin-dependent dehydrogenase